MSRLKARRSPLAREYLCDTGRHRKHLTRTPKNPHCTLTILRKSVYHVPEHLFTVSGLYTWEQ